MDKIKRKIKACNVNVWEWTLTLEEEYIYLEKHSGIIYYGKNRGIIHKNTYERNLGMERGRGRMLKIYYSILTKNIFFTI